MKKNIILGGILFLLATILISVFCYIVVIDRRARSEAEILKEKEMIENGSEKRMTKSSSLSENNKKPKDVAEPKDEAVDIESKDDAQKALEEVNEIVESMDDISF